MSTATTTDLCRVTVVTPTKFADLALPVHVPIGELLDAMLAACGDADFADDPVVAQRLSGAKLDPDHTIDMAGVRDGETLHLRRPDAAAPEMVFDDLIDGVGSVVGDRSDQWTPDATRQLLVALAATTLTFGLFALIWSGPNRSVAGQAGFVSLALVVAAAIHAQVFRRPVPARVCAVFAVLYAGLAGLAAPVWLSEAAPIGREITRGWLLSVDALIVSSVSIAVVSLLVLVAIGSDIDVFVGSATVGVGGAGTGVLVAAAGQTGAHAVATVATLLVLVAPLFTSLAYRCAGLRPPDLPTATEDLQSALVETVATDSVRRRAHRADRTLTGIVVGTSVVVAAWLPIVGLEPGSAPALLTALIAAALLIRSRVLTGGLQRVAVVGAALIGVATLVWRLWWSASADDAASPAAPGVVVALVVVSILALVAATVLPEIRLSPYWGRAADIGESLVALAMLPVLFGVLDVYDAARAVGG